jgi:hypothetical protein
MSTISFWSIQLHFVYNIVLKLSVALCLQCCIEACCCTVSTMLYWNVLLHRVYNVVLKRPIGPCLQYCIEASCCTVSTILCGSILALLSMIGVLTLISDGLHCSKMRSNIERTVCEACSLHICLCRSVCYVHTLLDHQTLVYNICEENACLCAHTCTQTYVK